MVMPVTHTKSLSLSLSMHGFVFRGTFSMRVTFKEISVSIFSPNRVGVYVQEDN